MGPCRHNRTHDGENRKRTAKSESTQKLSQSQSQSRCLHFSSPVVIHDWTEIPPPGGSRFPLPAKEDRSRLHPQKAQPRVRKSSGVNVRKYVTSVNPTGSAPMSFLGSWRLMRKKKVSHSACRHSIASQG